MGLEVMYTLPCVFLYLRRYRNGKMILSQNTPGPSEPSNERQLRNHQSHSIQRSEDTSSDAGTYTCTYHRCVQRFETPAQLQMHKREGHRQISPTSMPNAQSIALRNSQARASQM